MNSKPKKLLTSFEGSSLKLKNRVVMAPMTRSRAGDRRIPNQLMAKYYEQRTSAGLILTEATVISKQGIGWLKSPGIYNDEQVDGWKLVVEAVHQKNTPIFLQLWHCGRASHSSFQENGQLPVAPSPIKNGGEYIHTPKGKESFEVPRGLEVEEIPLIVEDYRRAAERAKQAGFDGVEIHAANGYLIDQFLQSKTNHRTDAYGGSIEKRFQFLKEVLGAVQTIWPSNRIGVRLAPNGVFNDMGSEDYRETFTYVVKQLNECDLAYVHIMDGLAFGFHNLGEAMTLKDFRKIYSGRIMGNCGYTEELAEQMLQEGNADLIAFGRPFISNPDLVERFQNGWALAPLADQSVWYSFDEKGYIDFPKWK